ncbi:MAG: glycoside hydrolase family 2 TIM barrel-domain containing protein [Flavobacteriaceae bacterium]|nr:glycoside hydrolase family 2 TIM barrel-domain containing protein [Flavobacteriaceae bacterium]
MKNVLIILLIFGTLMSCKKMQHQNGTTQQANPAKVTIVKNGEQFELQVDGKPFYIHGAGLEFGNIKALAEHGGNSFRTWRTENGKQNAKEVLDEAHKYGLKVMMGIEVARERHGFNYDDATAIQNQLVDIKRQVMELKDHPALLIWGIGNELNLQYTNPKVWDAVNDISKMIHEIDPNHPTTTSLAGISKKEINFIKEKCSDLDILSIQMYGDLPNLPKLIKEFGWNGPYMVTEWGATGHWEVPKTSWGAPIEQNSTVKADHYLTRYQQGIEVDKKQCVGSYVFLWGHKQERTPTWYGIFLENGDETESVDVMHYIWNQKWPKNRTPRIESFVLNQKTAYENIMLQADNKADAVVKIFDFENDKIVYRWEILPEVVQKSEGGDHEERPKTVEGIVFNGQDGTVTFNVPSQKGAYRLFVYASDGIQHSATANIPFLVK